MLAYCWPKTQLYSLQYPLTCFRRFRQKLLSVLFVVELHFIWPCHFPHSYSSIFVHSWKSYKIEYLWQVDICVWRFEPHQNISLIKGKAHQLSTSTQELFSWTFEIVEDVVPMGYSPNLLPGTLLWLFRSLFDCSHICRTPFAPYSLLMFSISVGYVIPTKIA